VKVNVLLSVLDREHALLTSENHHASAAILEDAAIKLRAMAVAMREAGLDPDATR
jgi:hypothetical protein